MNSNTVQKLKCKIPIQCQRMYKNDKQKSNQKKNVNIQNQLKSKFGILDELT